MIIKCVNNKNPKDKYGETPLHEAADNGHYEICQLIIENLEGNSKFF